MIRILLLPLLAACSPQASDPCLNPPSPVVEVGRSDSPKMVAWSDVHKIEPRYGWGSVEINDNDWWHVYPPSNKDGEGCASPYEMSSDKPRCGEAIRPEVDTLYKDLVAQWSAWKQFEVMCGRDR